MKKTLFIIIALFTIGSCSSDDSKDSKNTSCGSYNGQVLHLGEQGGCYYINSNGNKTYVERSNCQC